MATSLTPKLEKFIEILFPLDFGFWIRCILSYFMEARLQNVNFKMTLTGTIPTA